MTVAVSTSALDMDLALLDWRVVVNNGVRVPGDTRTFNSYNQP
jgi:hypothetical protein